MSNKQLAEDLGIVLKIKIDQYNELESAAKRVIKAFDQPQDYHVWDEALNNLEQVLKGKQHG